MDNQAIISRQGQHYVVSVDGEERGRFGQLMDASRFALGMMHDQMVGSVQLLSGLVITP